MGRLLLLVQEAFVCVFLGARRVSPACRAFTTSTRVARAAQYSDCASFSASCGKRYRVVGSKFTRTGDPVRPPFVAWAFQPVPFDVLLDELLAADDCFV